MRLLLALALGGVLTACDASPRGRDPSAPPGQRVREVAIRIDVPGGGTPSVSVLAFRAEVTGVPTSETLGLVDPLVAPAPEERCELREVATPARILRAQGGAVELQALPNVALLVESQDLTLRPAPRVYPQLAAVVGGVIGEAGPLDLSGLPKELVVTMEDGQRTAAVSVPGLPRLLDASGNELGSSVRLDSASDLPLVLDGPPRSFLEVRPFGATMSLACPAGPGGRLVVPRDLLERLLAASGPVPVHFEAVWRESHPWPGGGAPTHISIEVRSSVVLDRSGRPDSP